MLRSLWLAVILSFRHIWDCLITPSPKQLQHTTKSGNKEGLKAHSKTGFKLKRVWRQCRNGD